jgi:hypothetical protein
MLGFTPGFEALVGSEGFAFLTQEVQVSESCLVVGETDVVPTTTIGLDWRRPPEVCMDLSGEVFGTLALTFLFDGLTRGLGIYAGLAEGRFVS